MRFSRSHLLAFISFFAFCASSSILSGCASAPRAKPTLAINTISEIPAIYRSRIFLDLGRSLVFTPNSYRVSAYLTQVLTRMYWDIASRNFFLQVVHSPTMSQEPFIWVVVEDGGFIDSSLLRKVEGENELAALLAFAAERSQTAGYQVRFIQETFRPDIDWYRVRSYLEEENEEAIRNAIDRVYLSGYDVRGMLRVLDWIPEKNLDHTERLREIVRKKIASLAPLVNPVIRTPDYYFHAKDWMKP